VLVHNNECNLYGRRSDGLYWIAAAVGQLRAGGSYPVHGLSARGLLGSNKNLLPTPFLSNCALVSITNTSKCKALKCKVMYKPNPVSSNRTSQKSLSDSSYD